MSGLDEQKTTIVEEPDKRHTIQKQFDEYFKTAMNSYYLSPKAKEFCKKYKRRE
jgi:hypothetical protein